MAFDFGSDILVDAMRAADPQRAAEARMQLKTLSQNARAIDSSNIEFGTELAQGLKRTTPQEGPRETLQKFEAVVLSTFVQAMMPKDATSVFGEGLSGDMWKAQMARLSSFDLESCTVWIRELLASLLSLKPGQLWPHSRKHLQLAMSRKHMLPLLLATQAIEWSLTSPSGDIPCIVSV